MSAIDEARAKAKKFKEEAAAEREDVKVEETAAKQELDVIRPISLDRLKGMGKMGMKGVEVEDILPPRVVMIQGVKDRSELQDMEGNETKDGQFFHTSKRAIYSKFEGYIVYVKKGTWVDKQHPDWGELDKFDAIGVLKDDLTMFAITFKKTGRKALSSLFTAVTSTGQPMFCFNLSFESKILHGVDRKTGQPLEWFIPVVRVGKPEEDPMVLGTLLKIASQFDAKPDVEFDDEEAAGSTRVPPQPVDDAPWNNQEEQAPQDVDPDVAF